MLNRRDIAINKLKGLGEQIIEDVNITNVPSIKVPSRGTSNLVYDDAKTILRTWRPIWSKISW